MLGSGLRGWCAVWSSWSAVLATRRVARRWIGRGIFGHAGFAIAVGRDADGSFWSAKTFRSDRIFPLPWLLWRTWMPCGGTATLPDNLGVAGIGARPSLLRFKRRWLRHGIYPTALSRVHTGADGAVVSCAGASWVVSVVGALAPGVAVVGSAATGFSAGAVVGVTDGSCTMTSVT